MSPVLIRTRPQSAPAQARRDPLTVFLACAIGIAVLVGACAALSGPHFVDGVTIVNNTPYLVDVEVTNDARDGWLGLGPVSPGEQHNFESVADQGQHWIFHVTSGPYDGGEFRLSKGELEREHWRISIPHDVQSRLEANGAAPLRNR
jgi:hypothetical protein